MKGDLSPFKRAQARDKSESVKLIISIINDGNVPCQSSALDNAAQIVYSY